MRSQLIRWIRTFAPSFLNPQGERGIQERGHRDYVGGKWEQLGTLQFEFLLSRGLRPSQYLLDIACGSLRLGVKVIPYLERSHYLAVEKEQVLVEAGLEKELDPETRREKQPQIIISDSFEFEKLGRKADVAIAQSLFTHLPRGPIDTCFKNLRPWIETNGVFYATFFLTEQEMRNPTKPHDHGYFAYTRGEMCEFGENNDFTATYIGDWNHPRNQVIVEYRPN